MKPLELRFREEPGMGYPFVLNVSEDTKVQARPRHSGLALDVKVILTPPCIFHS